MLKGGCCEGVCVVKGRCYHAIIVIIITTTSLPHHHHHHHHHTTTTTTIIITTTTTTPSSSPHHHHHHTTTIIINYGTLPLAVHRARAGAQEFKEQYHSSGKASTSTCKGTFRHLLH